MQAWLIFQDKNQKNTAIYSVKHNRLNFDNNNSANYKFILRIQSS